ncbi:MAG TPA: class II aldolase/adducin family protein [Solirubrobacteraceae bacterium]|nr:class II aldolase/adducin family protein [Solirubrobacteraceae bacterium]
MALGRSGQQLQRLRADVAQAGRELAAAGLVSGLAGNVSARSGQLVAVTPTGGRLAALSADDIAIVDVDGDLVHAPLAPTSELPFHLAIYRRFGAGAVVHTHPPMATAVACVADELPCIHYSLLQLGGAIRVSRYATFGTDDLAATVVAALEGRSAALMASHGAVTLGGDLRAAIDASELLEWACAVYVHACACGTPRELAAGEQREVAEAFALYDRQRGAAREPPEG